MCSTEDQIDEIDEKKVGQDSKRKVGRCGIENVTYVITCHTCKKEGKIAKYFGETSGTAYLRGLKHIEDRRLQKDDSPLYKHDMVCHPKELDGAEYYMEVDRKHTKPLQRQVREMTMIDMRKVDIILNSKNEYNGGRLPRVVIENERRKGVEEKEGLEIVDKTAEEVNMNEVRIIGMVHRVSRRKERKRKEEKTSGRGRL